jgi:hypothetical protein
MLSLVSAAAASVAAITSPALSVRKQPVLHALLDRFCRTMFQRPTIDHVFAACGVGQLHVALAQLKSSSADRGRAAMEI